VFPSAAAAGICRRRVNAIRFSLAKDHRLQYIYFCRPAAFAAALGRMLHTPSAGEMIDDG